MSRKTEEDVVFVPVDELEKELGSVVQKLMNELRKSHSRNRDLEKELQSTEERNAITEERLHAMTDKKKREEKCFKEEFMALMDSHKRLESQLHKKISSEISLNRDLKKKETELQGKEEVIQKKNSDMEALNKHISDSKIYIEKLQSRIDDITENKAKDDLLHKETVESLLSRIENMEAQKTQDDLLHKETVEGLQSRIQEMSAEKTDTVKKLQAHVDEERKNRFELSYQYSQLIQTTQAPENVKKPYDPEHQIQSLLLLRQDKEQQTEISHYIAELSDEKKPTKLTEEFSELYDNEWIDAFEDTFKGNEKQTADFMLKLLMRANEICRNACSEHTSAIKRSFCTLVIETDPPMGEVCGEVPGRIASVGSKGKRQASDDRHGRTNIAKQKKNIETDFEQTLRNEENKTVIEIGKFFKQRLSEGVEKDNKNDETKSVPKSNKRKVGINFEQGLNKEQKNFIMKIRRVFEKQLSCEIEKVGTEIILEEQNVDTGMESIIAYIRKCMNICWSMYRHVPPVHVDFPDVTENIMFDTNIYKAYTKSGKYEQDIVWPAVYLHEGGPLLCKGVAQGRTSLTRF